MLGERFLALERKTGQPTRSATKEQISLGNISADCSRPDCSRDVARKTPARLLRSMPMTFLRTARAQVAPSSVTTCLVLAPACSGEAPADMGSGGGSSSGGTASGARGDGTEEGGASSGSASGGSESGSGGGSEVDYDSIGLVQVYRTLAHGAVSRASASFDLEEQAAWDALGEGQPSCVTTAYGDCRLTVCPPPTDPGPDPDVDPDDLPSLARLEAGTISVSSDSGEFTATGDPTGTNGTYVVSASGSFAGEEVVTVSAAGGTIEAFAGTIQIPLAPLLTLPAVSGEVAAVTSVPVSRAADFAFSWDARGTADTLEAIVLLPEDAPELSPGLTCTFDASAGSGVLLAEALEQLPVGTAIHFFSVNPGEVHKTKGNVYLAAYFELLSEDKTAYPQFVLE